MTYRYRIKSYCVAYECNEPLPGTPDYYRQFGNYCLKCCGKASTKALAKHKKHGFRDGIRVVLKESAKVL
jgi:hypothetical protein